MTDTPGQQGGDRSHDPDVPPRVPPLLKRSPRIREVYWCAFPEDAQLPEMWKQRPVVIFCKRTKLHEQTTVIPLSTKPQGDNPRAVQIKSPIDHQPAWALCSHITTVAVSRLSGDRNGTVRVSQEDFQKVVEVVFENLPDRLR